MHIRAHRALIVAPALVAGGAAEGLWAWRRWGSRVRAETREVAHVPDPPVHADRQPRGGVTPEPASDPAVLATMPDTAPSTLDSP